MDLQEDNIDQNNEIFSRNLSYDTIIKIMNIKSNLEHFVLGVTLVVQLPCQRFLPIYYILTRGILISYQYDIFSVKLQ